jgi:hypothetical protein
MKLRLHIDGEWTAEEFSDYFYALQSLSYYWIADMEYRFAPPKARDISLGRLRLHNAKLRVVQIQFASPGFTDLAGFGAILSEVRQFLQFLIDKVVQSEDRKLDREHKRLLILQTKMDIARQLVELDVNQSIAKLIETSDVDALIGAIQDGRLQKVELIEEKEI